MSVGLADLRGALHLGFDEASWINTSFNASMMFIRPFSVYLGGLLGPRRLLLACAWIFTAVRLLIPLCHSLGVAITLLFLAGLSAGTFYPLTLSFVLCNLPMRYVLLGIAMYATDIIFTTDMAQALGVVLYRAPLLALDFLERDCSNSPDDCPDPLRHSLAASSQNAAWASCSKLDRLPVRQPRCGAVYIALDQGQGLDWFHSSLIIGLTALGVLLVLAALVRHFVLPNPLVHYQFLIRRNTLLLALVLISFRFVMLATVVSIPSFLGSVRVLLPLQEAPVLIWVALPQFVLGVAAMALMRVIDPRLGALFDHVGKLGGAITTRKDKLFAS